MGCAAVASVADAPELTVSGQGLHAGWQLVSTLEARMTSEV